MIESTARPLAQITIHEPLDDVAAKLITCNGDGSLSFGYSASSIGECNLEQLGAGADFRDYILEGFVKYRLQLLPVENRCSLNASGYGSNRDYAIVSAIKQYLRAASVVHYEVAILEQQSKT